MKSEEVGDCWEVNAGSWTRQARAGLDVYRDALNTPAFLKILPDITGLAGLDIGCGEGANTRALAKLGARMTAIDIAPTFIACAKEAEQTARLGIDYQVGDGTQLAFADGSFDFATAFMSLMDMPDHDSVFRGIVRVLKPDGFLQFSILHPCFVPPKRKTLRNEHGKTVGVEVADYFDETAGEVETWWFSTLPAAEREHVAPFRVPRFHRTLSSWVNALCTSGLTIEEFNEPMADEILAATEPVVEDTRVAPIFLHIRARKKGLRSRDA